MKVIIYVEGPSDKFGLQELLASLIRTKLDQGISIEFFDTAKGDKKAALLTNIPRRAANILLNLPDSRVVILPDLYPKNKGFKHETFGELRDGVLGNLRSALGHKGVGDEDQRPFIDRFHVFCLKYDLEALILAAEDSLKYRLGAKSLTRTWQLPVEDQNHQQPPRRIVENLFREYNSVYKGTVDAPLILGVANYKDVASKCPQCFKPFVDFLEAL